MNAGMQNEGARRASGEGSLGSPNTAARMSTGTNGSSGMRAGIERRRRRSSIRMNLNLNDPAIPAPGEMQPSSSSISGSRRGRSPSIGEVYQDMESEQEAQVVGPSSHLVISMCVYQGRSKLSEHFDGHHLEIFPVRSVSVKTVSAIQVVA